MWERERASQISILSLNCVHFILVIWFHSHKPFGHLFETRAQQLIRFFSRKKMLCGFLCGDGNFTQLSFSYDQWLFFVAIVFSCWKKSWFAFFLFSLALMKNIDKMTESTSCCMMVLAPKRERKHWCKNKCFSKVYAISNGILINSYCSNLLWAICVCSTVFKLICHSKYRKNVSYFYHVSLERNQQLMNNIIANFSFFCICNFPLFLPMSRILSDPWRRLINCCLKQYRMFCSNFPCKIQRFRKKA